MHRELRRFDRKIVHTGRFIALAALAWVTLALLATASSCGGGGAAGPPAPRAGRVSSDAPAWVRLPVGALNAAGGNWFVRRVDLSIDTRIGTRVVTAVWNSASPGWRWSFEMSYDGASFRDATGAPHDAALADGAPLPGTSWRRLDAQRLSTRGGLVHAFDPADGRLAAVYWADAPWPRLVYVAGGGNTGGPARTVRVDQCTAAGACTLVYDVERDPAGRVVALADRAGRRAEFAYDGDGNLVRAASPADVAASRPGRRYEYRNRQLVARVSGDGERVEATFSSGRLQRLRQVRAPGAGTDPEWRVNYGTAATASLYQTVVTRPLGGVETYVYDAERRVVEHENAVGDTERWSWDGVRPASHVDAGGATTRWIWQDDENVQRTEPSGNTVVTTLASGGVNRAEPGATAVAEVRDDLGVRLTRGYGPLGRPVYEENAAGDRTSYTWNADGSLASRILPGGRTTTYTGYGEHGHPTTVAHGGWVAQRVYDAVGNLVRGDIPDPHSGGVMARHWDADRRVVALDLIDRPVSGSATVAPLTITRRSDGRVVAISRPGGGDTAVGYDDLGREIVHSERTSDGNGGPAQWSTTLRTWDDEGRLLSVTRPNGMQEVFGYDAAGRRVRETRLRDGVVESDLVQTYAGGRLVLSADPARGFSESRVHDAAGRIVTQVHSGGERTQTGYDLRSRPVSRRLEDAAGTLLLEVRFGYDAADRLEWVGDGAAELVRWLRVDGIPVHVSHGNGIQEHADVLLSRLETRSWSRGGVDVAASAASYRADGWQELEIHSVVAPELTGYHFKTWQISPGEGPERRVEGAFDTVGGTWAWSYDHASNLTRATTPERGTIDFGYNAQRNRLLDARRAGQTLATWSWDAAGFATSRGGASLGWNARGQLVSLMEGGVERAHFVYDAQGRRLARTLDGQTVRWTHGGLLECDASGQPVAADLGPVRIALDGNHLYRHSDLRGNVFMETDAAGLIVQRAEFGAYGEGVRSGPSLDREHGFARGLVLPADTVLGSLQIVGARVYDPLAGRFLSPDPVAQWVNAYAYTQGNPLEFWDPSGRSFESIDWGQVGAWAIAVGSGLGAAATCGVAVAEPTPFGELFCAAAVTAAIGFTLQAIDYSGASIQTVVVGFAPFSLPTVPAFPLPKLSVTLHDPPFPDDIGLDFGTSYFTTLQGD